MASVLVAWAWVALLAARHLLVREWALVQEQHQEHREHRDVQQRLRVDPWA